MLGPTHRFGGIAFGAVTPIVMEKVFSINVSDPVIFALFAMAGGAIGSLIPDIDSPNSTLGKRIKPISRQIADKMGHRGGTHSLIALIIFGVITTLIGIKLEDILYRNLNGKNHIIFSIATGLILMSSVLFVIQCIPIKKNRKFKKKHSTIVVLCVFIVSMYVSYEFSNEFLAYIRVYLLGVFVGYVSHIFLDMFTRGGVPLFKPFINFRIRFTRFKTGSAIEEVTKVICTIVVVISLLSLSGIITINNI